MDRQALEAHLNRPLTEIEREIFDQWGHTGVLDPLEKHAQAKLHKPPQPESGPNRLRDLLAQYELDESIAGIQELARKVPIWVVRLKNDTMIYSTGELIKHIFKVVDAYIADPRWHIGFCDSAHIDPDSILYMAQLSQEPNQDPDGVVVDDTPGMDDEDMKEEDNRNDGY